MPFLMRSPSGSHRHLRLVLATLFLLTGLLVAGAQGSIQSRGLAAALLETPPPYLAQWGTAGNDNGQFNYPAALAVDSAGHVYVADAGNHRIQKFDSNGRHLATWGSVGSSQGLLNLPLGIAVDNLGHVYVADTNNHRIQQFDANGAFLNAWGTEGSDNGQFNTPTSVAIDSSGHVYVADSGNSRVEKFDSNGLYLTTITDVGAEQLQQPYGIAVDSNDNLYVTDLGASRLQKFDSNGAYLTGWGANGSDAGQLQYPYAVAVDSNGDVYVADTFNHRIQQFDNTGAYLTEWGTEGDAAGQFSRPAGIAVDSYGTIYVTDQDNQRIQSFGVAAEITIVLNARPNLPTNLGFRGSLGGFILDDAAVDDSDAYTNTRSFTVAPGVYSIQRNNPNAWFTTTITCTPGANTVTDLPNRRATLTVVGDDQVICIFTVDRAVQIIARAFNDLIRNNNNLGKRNIGDPWLEGWMMTVATGPSAIISSAVTEPTAIADLYEAHFRYLLPGSYTVCTTLPDPSWTPTLPATLDPAYEKPCQSVTLAPGQRAALRFGAYQPTFVTNKISSPADEVIIDETPIIELPYDPAEDETVADESGLLQLFLPLLSQ